MDLLFFKGEIMKKKRIIAFLLVLVMLLTVACKGSNGSEKESKNIKEEINIVALKGPTGMGIAGLFDKDNYNIEILASPDEVVPKVVNGEVDLAFLPSNLASVLYNKTEGNVKALSISTLGVLYILENGDSIHSIEDLSGKTIYGSGKNGTPEYALNYILQSNGIDANVEWKSEHAEALQAMLSEENAIALLPQPFVSVAESKSENVRIALDLTEEWEKLQKDEENPSALVMGVVVANKDFLEKYPDSVDEFLEDYNESSKWVNENIDDAAKVIGENDIVEENIAKKAIAYSNIVSISGDEMKEKLSGFLKVLFDQDPKSVGGKLPEEDFYIISK